MGAVGCLGRVGQQLVDLAGNVAFQTADDLFSGFAFRLPSLDVFDGWLVRAHAGGGDTPQGVVGLAVAAAVETVPHDRSRGRLDRTCAA